jgi:hypothetical protein
MKKHHTLALLLCLAALIATGCEQTSIARQEEIVNDLTAQALTPTATATATPTNTPTATATATATQGPSPTPVPPTATTIPTATPLPPTATPNPALKDFSLCTTLAGTPDSGRFAMQVQTISTTVEANFERVTFNLSVPGDSAAPYLVARCAPAATGYEIALDLAGWQHDDLFRTSVATATQTLSGTKLLSQIEYRVLPDSVAGATIVLPIAEPHAFRVSIENNPARIVLEVAKPAALSVASDMLTLPNATATPADPIYYLAEGDIWSLVDGKATNLTDSAEVETALAASQGAGRLAFCRATSAPDDATEISSLWVMETDGADAQELAAPGRSCSQPAFSADGKQIAFVVDEDASGALPARLSIWTIDLTSGAGPVRVAAANDEWSRSGPQWLAGNTLIYTGRAEDGRSTLFIRTAQKQELDVGAPLLVTDNGQGQSIARYQSFGALVAAADGKRVAVEAIRADATGADLLILNERGDEQKSPTNTGYWSRPVAFGTDGTLYYLVSQCASAAVQNYALIARSSDASEQTLALGTSTGGIGTVIATDQGLGYVAFAAPGTASARGPLVIPQNGTSSIWFWDLASGGRSKLVESSEPIRAVAR